MEIAFSRLPAVVKTIVNAVLPDKLPVLHRFEFH
jgi:hypothetical protein